MAACEEALVHPHQIQRPSADEYSVWWVCMVGVMVGVMAGVMVGVMVGIMVYGGCVWWVRLVGVLGRRAGTPDTS